MADYAGTNTIIFQGVVWGNKLVSLLKVDVTNYNSTGIPLVASTVGLSVIEAVLPFENAGGYHTKWIEASGIMKCYVITTGVECADDVDIGATQMIYALVVGV
jgi:hypothetical protein